MIVDDFEIDEVLNFKGRQFEIDEKWLEIEVKDVEAFDIRPISRNSYSKSKDWNKVALNDFENNDIISTLNVDCKSSNQGKNHIKLFVPYGSPEYSCFYYLNVPSNFQMKNLSSALKQHSQSFKNFKIFMQTTATDQKQQMGPYDLIPQHSYNGWPRLYLKHDN